LKAGRGIGTAQVLLVADELKRGQLIRVLPEYELMPTELFLTYPSSKFMRPAIRSFIDFAVPALRKIEGIVQGRQSTDTNGTSHEEAAMYAPSMNIEGA
jgi:hypothetical protein